MRFGNNKLEQLIRGFDLDSNEVCYNPESYSVEQVYNPSLQIDWITAKIPFYSKNILNGGNIINTSPDGEVEYTIDKRLPVKGSFDSNLSIRTADVLLGTRETCLIELSGNPVKWFQGHNIFGTEDLTNLIYETILRLADLLNCPQPVTFLNWVKKGFYKLSRVDITGMFSLPTRSDVYTWLYHAESHSRTRAGTALSKGNSIYLNKNSKRWSVVFYSKGQELEAHNLPQGLIGYNLEEYANNKLRIELRLKHKELNTVGLSKGFNWFNLDPMYVYKDYLDRIEMAEQKMRDDKLLKLPMKLRATYSLWKEGHDIKQMMSKRTYYRHRKELLEYDIDISIKMPSKERKDSNTNVVPLKRILELKPAGIPHWAKGTNLYFEPRKICK